MTASANDERSARDHRAIRRRAPQLGEHQDEVLGG
jgi:hypothetical protein